MQYFFLFTVFFIMMFCYFKVAKRYNIIDQPNERSSHTESTIRGGGVIYLFAALCCGVMHPEYWLSVLGVFIIGMISFIDDRMTISSKIRIVFHLAAVTLLFIFLNVFQIYQWWIIPILYIVVIGIINAYNFMDGINGITGAYSLVVLAGLQYVNFNVHEFIHADLIWLPILASVVFLYFNFRKKAKCFAGDVGSVTIAFWIIFLILKLMLLSDNYTYILFLSVYGVDTILTIIHRLKLKHNIFDAHRLHFYQMLANEKQWPQLGVSTTYAFIQLGIIVAIVFSSWTFLPLFFVTVIPMVIIYVWAKPRMMIKSGL